MRNAKSHTVLGHSICGFTLACLLAAPTLALAQTAAVQVAGVYAVELGGSPGVIELNDSGFTATDDLWQFANSCVPTAHLMGGGKGGWRFDRGTGRRAIVARTLHATVDANVRAQGFAFAWVNWQDKFFRVSGQPRFMGGATIQYYDSLENVNADRPMCTSNSMDVRGLRVIQPR